jgi:FkbM family methyltransferase
MQRREFVTGVAAGAAGAVAGAFAARKWRSGGDMPEHSRLSFSQQGEDIILYHAIHDLFSVQNPTYVDVGAAHPIKSNNTYLLYGTGGHGVLVEPNPAFAAELRKARPKDVTVQAGIGFDDTKEADYYQIAGNPMLNTFSREQVDRLQAGKTASVVERVVKMPLLNINDVIATHLGTAPDILSTDVEGLDFAILKTLDLKRFRPKVICTEGVPMERDGSASEIWRYLKPEGYILRGSSMVNSIFVDATRITA